MKIKARKLAPTAQLPTRAHTGDAGLDMYVSRCGYEGELWVCHSDIAMEIPDGYVGLLFPRSSVSSTDMRLANSVGVIDSGYRGEVSAKFDNKPNGKRYYVGDRFAQLVIVPYLNVQPIEADTLSDTERGNGGYGSTGQ